MGQDNVKSTQKMWESLWKRPEGGSPWTPNSKEGEAAWGRWRTWPSKSHAGHARGLWEEEHRPRHPVIGSLLSPAKPGVGCGHLTQYLPLRDLSSIGETRQRVIQTDRQTKGKEQKAQKSTLMMAKWFSTKVPRPSNGDTMCVCDSWLWKN